MSKVGLSMVANLFSDMQNLRIELLGGDEQDIRLGQMLLDGDNVMTDKFNLISLNKWEERDALIEDLTHLSTSGNDMSDKRTVTRKEVRRAIVVTWDSNWHDSRTQEGEVEVTIARLTELGIEVEEEEEREQEPMDKETAGDMKYHELKDEDKLDRFGRRK